jgi:hypothetical protein
MHVTVCVTLPVVQRYEAVSVIECTGLRSDNHGVFNDPRSWG